MNKKPISIVLLLMMFVFPILSAVEIQMNSEFDSGETLIASVSGNFLDKIIRENILFYHDHVRIPVFYDVKEINEDFYIYALLTEKTAGNYSMIIKNVRYIKGTQIIEEEIRRNFTITDEIADFYVNPGCLITSENFFLEVQNLKDERITISIKTPKTLDSDSSIELKSGDLKKINFYLNTEESVFDKIELTSAKTSYSVLFFIYLPEKINDSEGDPKTVDFKFEPDKANVSLATNSTTKRIIYLKNLGKEIENLSIYVSSSLEHYINVSPSIIEELSADEAIKIEISIASDNEEKIVEGRIYAKAENFEIFFTPTLYFVKDYIPEIKEDEETEDEIILTSCAQLGGIVCGPGEKCTGDSLPTKEGICCFAICEAPSKSNTGKIIGWSLVAIVIIFVFWFFKKYKRVRPKVDLLKIGKGKK